MRLAALTACFAVAVVSHSAEAQYRNALYGLEGGYTFLGQDSGLEQHSWTLGLRAAYKSSDHWWLSAKGLVGFRGPQQDPTRTVILLQLVPIDARYYFATDQFRPFVGVSNAFQFLVNRGEAGASLYWGPGVIGGAEFKLQRDLFLGFEVDAFHMFVFQHPDTALVNATAQLLFFF